MSLGFVKPEDSQVPVASLEKVRAAGLDASRVMSCAVPRANEVAGCRHARECALRGFGREENLGFGPKSMLPGTPGEGPSNIAVYISDKASSTETTKEISCVSYMNSLHKRAKQATATDDQIIILGGPGTEYLRVTMVPKDPNNNKSGDLTMVQKVDRVKVSEWPTLEAQSPMLEHALEMKALRQRALRDRFIDANETEDGETEGGTTSARRRRKRATGADDGGA